MRRRKRTTGRFWLFLLILFAIAGFLLWKNWPFRSNQTVLMMMESQTSISLDVVLVRDEDVYMATQVADLDFCRAERSLVNIGETVAYIYSTGYTESLLTKLDDIREDIQSYHETLLGNIIDTQLDALNDIVSLMGEEVRDVALGRTSGSIQDARQKLETAMANRQTYMRQNQQSDSKLIQLYQEESSQLSGIASMRKSAVAAMTGVVSYHVDGYEKDLSADGVASLTVEDVQTVLAGGSLAHTAEVSEYGVFRVVDESSWYVAAVYAGSNWTPVLDQEYQFTLAGYEDLGFAAKVEYVQKVGGNTLVIFRVEQPMGSLIYQRTGRGTFSINITGFSVSKAAIHEQNGQTGVWVVTDTGETFVEVDVLTSDSENAIIEPRVEGALQIGQAVIIK